MTRPILQLQCCHPGATIPKYQTTGAAGMDLHACLDTDRIVEPGSIETIQTGIIIALPSGYEGQVRPRSGLASKYGITLPNAPGTIDEDYRGEVSVPLINLSQKPFTIQHGVRIAQLVIAPVVQCEIITAETLESTERGVGGFGSTGH